MVIKLMKLQKLRRNDKISGASQQLPCDQWSYIRIRLTQLAFLWISVADPESLFLIRIRIVPSRIQDQKGTVSQIRILNK